MDWGAATNAGGISIMACTFVELSFVPVLLAPMGMTSGFIFDSGCGGEPLYIKLVLGEPESDLPVQNGSVPFVVTCATASTVFEYTTLGVPLQIPPLENTAPPIGMEADGSTS